MSASGRKQILGSVVRISVLVSDRNRRCILESLEAALRDFERRATESHFMRLRAGRAESIETSSIHVDVIRDLKRINGHLTSVAYQILETAGELTESRLKSDVAPEYARSLDG